MELEAAKKYVHILLNHIFDILFVNQLGVNHAEHIFICILNLVKEDIDLRNWFLKLVENNLLSDEQNMTKLRHRPELFIDPDLICFIAHATRWNEFESMAKLRKFNLSTLNTLNNERDLSDLLLDALNDNWEDKDFYKYFEH